MDGTKIFYKKFFVNFNCYTVLERDWRCYAERATACAFGIAGDMVLAQSAAMKEKEGQEQEKREEEARREEAEREAPRMRMR